LPKKTVRSLLSVLVLSGSCSGLGTATLTFALAKGWGVAKA
jgi:2-phosphoglycerate kinase